MKFEGIRPATQAEIDSIKDSADLDDTALVIAMDAPGGTMLAVRRLAVEIDPMFIPAGTPTKWKKFFGDHLESFLKGQGARKYYFQVPVREEEWRKVLEEYGAEAVSPEPEIRYAKVLIKAEVPNGNQDKNEDHNRL